MNLLNQLADATTLFTNSATANEGKANPRADNFEPASHPGRISPLCLSFLPNITGIPTLRIETDPAKREYDIVVRRDLIKGSSN